MNFIIHFSSPQSLILAEMTASTLLGPALARVQVLAQIQVLTIKV